MATETNGLWQISEETLHEDLEIPVNYNVSPHRTPVAASNKEIVIAPTIVVTPSSHTSTYKRIEDIDPSKIGAIEVFGF